MKLSPEDLASWRELVRRCDEGGNDGADVYEAEEFAKHIEQKYSEDFNLLLAMSETPRMNEQTHRLTNLPGEKHPLICQKCGGVKGGDPSGTGQARILRLSLDRWQECDHNDNQEALLIVLCSVCAGRIIEQHPRLYHKLDANQPWPGCMTICVNCKFRDGIKCTHPNAKANGGPGVMLTIAQPIRSFIDGAKYRGPFEYYPTPASACKQRELVEARKHFLHD